MKTYNSFRPTQFDHNIPLADRSDWLVLPCARNRDSDCLEESNFETALDMLGGESETCEVHRFGHWANAWFEVIIVRPTSDAHSIALEIEKKLENYPVLDEEDLIERQYDVANETWISCYNDRQRLEFIRKNRSQFEFCCWEELLSCVRGNFFGGYASELIGE